VGAGERPDTRLRDGSSRFIYTLKEVAGMIGENLELVRRETGKE
jgi:hypothetical protein